jgi:hypothetical protein
MQVLRAADARLRVLRAGSIPDRQARHRQQSDRGSGMPKLLGEITGEKAVVVLSDGQSRRPDRRVRRVRQRWLVAYGWSRRSTFPASLSASYLALDLLFFAQAIGRFVRVRRPGETATVFLPSVPHLLALASEMEAQRDHVLGAKRKEGFDDELIERAQHAEQASDDLASAYQALSATAELDQVIFDGASFGSPVLAGTPEEEEYLGLPGLLTPDQVATLLSRRQAEQTAAAKRRAATGTVTVAEPTSRPITAGERRIALRRQLNGLVAAHHHRTGLPHGKIHAELRRLCGGPPSAQATIAQLEERIATLRTL